MSLTWCITNAFAMHQGPAQLLGELHEACGRVARGPLPVVISASMGVACWNHWTALTDGPKHVGTLVSGVPYWGVVGFTGCCEGHRLRLVRGRLDHAGPSSRSAQRAPSPEPDPHLTRRAEGGLAGR